MCTPPCILRPPTLATKVAAEIQAAAMPTTTDTCANSGSPLNVAGPTGPQLLKPDPVLRSNRAAAGLTAALNKPACLRETVSCSVQGDAKPFKVLSGREQGVVFPACACAFAPLMV